MTTTKPTFKTIIQPPPGPITYPESKSNTPWPPTFRDAFSIRKTVFCDEQHCSLDTELDEDEYKSWSWVVYAEGTEGESGKAIPVGTLRLVPPPQGAHPTPIEGLRTTAPNRGHVGDEKEEADEEPYAKLTRLAFLPEYRGLRLGKKVVSTALYWASQHMEELSSPLGREKWKGLLLIHAQVSVEKVWGKMGFVTDEGLGRWDEEGIMHLGMWKRVELNKA